VDFLHSQTTNRLMQKQQEPGALKVTSEQISHQMAQMLGTDAVNPVAEISYRFSRWHTADKRKRICQGMT